MQLIVTFKGIICIVMTGKGKEDGERVTLTIKVVH
jgi:hypothetical protein